MVLSLEESIGPDYAASGQSNRQMRGGTSRGQPDSPVAAKIHEALEALRIPGSCHA
jgi:hypothetical protein